MSSSIAGSIYTMLVGKISLGSSRRYIASNFTDVIVNTTSYTMSNMSGIQKSAANKKYIFIYKVYFYNIKSLSMSGSVAGSITCFLARYILSYFGKWYIFTTSNLTFNVRQCSWEHNLLFNKQIY